MISYLSGKVREIKRASIVLVVNNVGFLVGVPEQYSFQIGESIELEVYSHYTQDNGQHLFGFKTVDEKTVFSLILGCSGIGPKIGVSALSMLTPAVFISAIMTDDIKTLSSIEGIGRKKAESIALQLKDKVAKISLSKSADIPQAASTMQKLNEVLGSLGYSRQEISRTIEHLKESQIIKSKNTFDEIIRSALAFASKKQIQKRN